MPATVKGGLFPTNGVDVLTTIHTTSAGRRTAAMALGWKQNRALRGFMTALNGVAPGGIANVTNSRVSAAEELGGVRPIETEVLVNRATTVADRDDINSDVLTHSTGNTFGPNPPPNLDGNPLGTR